MNNSSNVSYGAVMDKVSLPVVTLMRLTSALIIVMNGGVLFCLAMNKKRLSRLYTLHLTCLSLNDFVAGISVFMVSFLDGGPFMHHFKLCCATLWFFVACQCATLYNILGMCVSRLCVIQKLTTKAQLKKTHLALCSGGGWLISFGLCALPYLLFAVGEKEVNSIGCSMETVFLENFPSMMKINFGILLLPLILTNILYIVAFRLLRRTIRRTCPEVTDIPPMAVVAVKDCNPEQSAKKTSAIAISYNGCNATETTDLSESSNTPQACASNKPKTFTNETYVQSISKTTRHTSTGTVKFKTTIQYGATPNGQNMPHSALAERPPPRTTTTRRLRQHGKTFLVLCLILVFLNIFTWPGVFVLGSQALFNPGAMPRSVKFPLFSTLAVNSAINPLLYAALVPEFRGALRDTAAALLRGTCHS